MFGKRGFGLSMEVIVGLILALLVLVFAFIIFAGPSNAFLEAIKTQLGFGQELVGGANGG